MQLYFSTETELSSCSGDLQATQLRAIACELVEVQL